MSLTIYHPTKSRPVQGVLFDMDGVILDSEILYSRFWREGCAFYGYDMDYPQSLGMRSLNANAGQAYLSSLFGPEISYTLVRKKRIELMDIFVGEHGIALKPGIFELLDALEAKGLPCAMTTASPMDRVEEYLGRYGLLHRFTRICTTRQVAHGKPEPDIYLFGAASLGLNPENCIALEDSYAGMLSAHRAGCMNIIVPDLDQPDEKLKEIAYAKADSLADVIDLL